MHSLYRGFALNCNEKFVLVVPLRLDFILLINIFRFLCALDCWLLRLWTICNHRFIWNKKKNVEKKYCYFICNDFWFNFIDIGISVLKKKNDWKRCEWGEKKFEKCHKQNCSSHKLRLYNKFQFLHMQCHLFAKLKL